MKRLCVVLVAAAMAACSPGGEKANGAGGTAVQPAEVANAGGGERFYGQERFTVVTRHSGRQTGTTTIHVRDWGRRWVEVNDTNLSASGINVPTRNRVIHEGARTITIDAASGRATAITNPLYDQVVDAMRGRSGVEFGQQIMTQMGGRETGESGAFAGHDCRYWEIASLGSRSCVTPWGATLHLTSALGGISLEQTAQEVRIGDGGPDEAFSYDPASVTEGPDVGDLMQQMRRN